MSDSTLVIIPTYNEKDNLPEVIERLTAAQPEVDVLVVDDSSPDGTGEIADALAADNPRINVLHRKEKTGLWGAYKAGFEWGLERDYAILCEMDADGSHAPEQLGRLLDGIADGADMVIGSRYVRGGSTVNWPVSREVLSRGGNLYISVALGAGVRDITAGYRAIRREVLETLDLDRIGTSAYLFQTELAWRAAVAGFIVEEVPITFTERKHGESKMSGGFITESLSQVTKWGLKYRFNHVKYLAGDTVDMVKHDIKS